MTEYYTLTLPLLDLTTADEPARTALERGSRSGPFLPNMYRAMANAPGLLDTYLSGYARFREESGFTPQEQEVVFLTISAENGCEYCVAAHSVIADTKSRLPHDVTDALRAGQPLPDSRLDSLSDFTRHFLLERGRPTREAVEAFLSAGYTETHILYIILALSVKTMSNYANHVFDTPVDPVFRAREWNAFRLATKAFQAVTRRP